MGPLKQSSPAALVQFCILQALVSHRLRPHSHLPRRQPPCAVRIQWSWSGHFFSPRSSLLCPESGPDSPAPPSTQQESKSNVSKIMFYCFLTCILKHPQIHLSDNVNHDVHVPRTCNFPERTPGLEPDMQTSRCEALAPHTAFTIQTQWELSLFCLTAASRSCTLDVYHKPSTSMHTGVGWVIQPWIMASMRSDQDTNRPEEPTTVHQQSETAARWSHLLQHNDQDDCASLIF